MRIGRPNETPQHDLGDELEMLRRRGIPVVSAPDRLAGAHAAIAEGARCIVLDDGFQHRRIHRDVDIVCVDARWPRGGGPIPVGTAREPWSALRRADLVVVYGQDPLADLPDGPHVCARLVPAPTHHLGETIDVALGIARPSGVLATLVARGHTVRTVNLVQDHGPLPPVPPGSVVTEKDAARLPPNADVQVLRADLALQDPAVIDAVLHRAGIATVSPPAPSSTHCSAPPHASVSQTVYAPVQP